MGHHDNGPVRSASARSVRIVGGLVLLGVAVAVLWGQHRVRTGEIDIAGHWFGWILDGGASTNRDTLYFSWSGGSLIGLRDTWECTVALLASPLCAIGAVLLMCTRMPWRRLLCALAAALAMVVAVNQLRLLMIAVSLQHWGQDGYEITHKFAGSLFAIAGFAASLVLLLKIATRSTGPAAPPSP